jgi:hypothetical protein
MTGDRLDAHAYIVVAVSAYDVRMIFTSTEYLSPAQCTGTGEECGDPIDAAPLRAAQPPGNMAIIYFHNACLAYLINDFQYNK